MSDAAGVERSTDRDTALRAIPVADAARRESLNLSAFGW
jgi:hypothetical protein